ncbi:MAG: hypothetical protein HQK54_10470 [Oligoflexales bacterium]|nr:hypothetical protein [Oligoflexales bacterium]
MTISVNVNPLGLSKAAPSQEAKSLNDECTKLVSSQRAPKTTVYESIKNEIPKVCEEASVWLKTAGLMVAFVPTFVAGRVAEAVIGERFTDYLRDHILLGIMVHPEWMMSLL